MIRLYSARQSISLTSQINRYTTAYLPNHHAVVTRENVKILRKTSVGTEADSK